MQSEHKTQKTHPFSHIINEKMIHAKLLAYAIGLKTEIITENENHLARMPK